MATREEQNIRNQVTKNMRPFPANQDPTSWNGALSRGIKNRDYYNSKQLEIEKGGGGLSENWKNYDNGQSLIDSWFFTSSFGVTERRLTDHARGMRNRIAKIASWRETQGFTNPTNYYDLVYMETKTNWESLNNTNWNVPLSKIWKKEIDSRRLADIESTRLADIESKRLADIESKRLQEIQNLNLYLHHEFQNQDITFNEQQNDGDFNETPITNFIDIGTVKWTDPIEEKELNESYLKLGGIAAVGGILAYLVFKK